MLLAIALILRLISLATYPLMDTTEARYGEMARLMVETGNWLTPQFDYGVPFWGKPPLFTWMSAYGIELFGLSEFAVRAPHWLAGVATIGLMSFMAHRLGYSALVTAVVLATCGIFSIASGAVMTDMALTLAMTMAMLGFYLAWREQGTQQRLWGYVGFVGLAIGLLAKGPIVLVLVGLTVMPWLMLQHGPVGAFKVLWQRFPLLSGTALMLAIALPWYVLAERATPGFLDYFLVGEHFKRFVVSGWDGDLYGTAHDRPRGMIWWYWLQAAFPWSLVLPVLLWLRRAKVKQAQQDNGLFSFLLLWMLSPMVLFTMAGNILPAYVLPGVPALALLVALLYDKYDAKWFSGVALVLPILLMIMMLVLNMGKADSRSDRIVFEHVQEDIPAYYVAHRPFSGQFYSQGHAKLLTDEVPLEALDNYYLIGKSDRLRELVQQQALSCTQVFIAPSGRQLLSCHGANASVAWYHNFNH
ncbi:glycosyltransferase family 39 protein [Marinomonas ostreistagni]|nr:glycosyltransferase family 39 protein [Marinomonas ostreistagni]MBM6551120.1 glycosyltransferase family 39 protein [Marinomonas ostreistagni]